MSIQTILYGHTSRKTAIVQYDKNKRSKHATRYCWIETKPGKGDRMGWVISYPNTGQFSDPYYKKFATLAFLYYDHEEQLQDESIAFDDTSKSNKEKFNELMKHLDPSKLSSEQQYHIRHKIYNVFLANTKTEQPNLTGKQYNLDWEWTRNTLQHIENCPFPEIGNYPDFQAPPDWPLLLSRRYDTAEEVEHL